jgi:predicted MFS family arabinose efflux permease
LSRTYIGVIMAANGVIIALVEMILVYKMQNKGKNALLIATGVGLFGISFFMLNIPGIGALMAFVIIVIITFGEIFSMPFMNTYWISRTQHSNRGQYAALYTMAWSAAQSLGPFYGAKVADHAGFAVLWWIVGSIALFAAISFYRILSTRF